MATNFVRDVVAGLVAAPALVERTATGDRRTHPAVDLVDRSRRLAATLHGLGTRRGDVVLTLIGNRVEWVETMLACFAAGYVVLPCTEQLRVADLRHRFGIARPSVVVADERNRATVEAAAPACPVVLVPDPGLYAADPVPYVDLAADDPCLVTFTSGTSGPPKAVRHTQRYLSGQRLQAEHWVGARPGDVAWCTAATGWSKSARNAFIAPWLCGATALVHDARFDPDERLAVAAEEGVTVWCMAPTEYRVIAAAGRATAPTAMRELLAAGEALDVETVQKWRDATGLQIRDGYGQTETGALTGNLVDRAAPPGSMGKPLPGIRAWIDDGELVVDPATVPTFFAGYSDEPAPTGPWRTGDHVRQDDDGYLYFDSRADDVIVSAGYRIGPFEVESVLATHPAVVESAVVGAPHAERGEIVRAVVVLRDGYAPSDSLVRELQEHVRAATAPYKYPRQVDFVTELPKTASGKLRRAALRARP